MLSQEKDLNLQLKQKGNVTSISISIAFWYYKLVKSRKNNFNFVSKNLHYCPNSILQFYLFVLSQTQWYSKITPDSVLKYHSWQGSGSDMGCWQSKQNNRIQEKYHCTYISPFPTTFLLNIDKIQYRLNLYAEFWRKNDEWENVIFFLQSIDTLFWRR